MDLIEAKKLLRDSECQITEILNNLEIIIGGKVTDLDVSAREMNGNIPYMRINFLFKGYGDK